MLNVGVGMNEQCLWVCIRSGGLVPLSLGTCDVHICVVYVHRSKCELLTPSHRTLWGSHGARISGAQTFPLGGQKKGI